MDGFGDYPGYTHGDGCPCPMCKPLPRVAYGFEVTESRLIDDDTVLVIDKAALTSARLVEPKWEPPPDYRTALMQERIYLGLDFGRTEPEWRMLQRRADDALHRAIGSRDPFGRRWWRDLWDSIRLGFKACYVRAARPDAEVPTAAMSVGRITGLA
jgi:hypothetical protein